ncbi:hypothetical protein [Chitinophaga ginsengisoli]|uniref:hypothetical protein n=1 Tax=Chitinophaga ginsengisoli TaxID=363837 RepID=UPI0011B27CF9|nr:hypothetical protein [Chitinophaga ginsengisoli]
MPTLTDLTHSPTLSGIDGLSYSKALNGRKPEAHDLAASYPQKVKELSRLMLRSESPAEHSEFDWSAIE